MKKLMHPDAADNASAGNTNNSSPTDTHVRHLHNLPDKDATLLSVNQTVNSKWSSNAFVTLIWKTQPDFAGDVSAFEKQLQQRNTVGSKRSQQTINLQNMDIEAEDGLPYVKSNIAATFGPPNATAHYNEFGIIHRNSGWDLPTNRQKRKDALRMMVDAFTANKMDDKKYGIDFWTDLYTRYSDAADEAVAGAADVSDEVGDLVTLRTILRRVLHGILLILEANYPDTFDQQKRAWGFLKESY